MRYTSYSNKQSEIVKSGIDAIAETLNNGNTSEKESLLLCLDKFLDPYYGYNLPHKNEIILLLENVIVNQNSIGVKEDALNLLTSYCYPPFNILESNIDKIESELLPDVKYAINMDEEFSKQS